MAHSRLDSAADYEEVVFGEDHAEFIRRDGSLTTTMDVLVSGEADGEVRRVSLANSGRRAREIELTSYAEIVLRDARCRLRASRLLTDVCPDRKAPCGVRRAGGHAPSAFARRKTIVGCAFRGCRRRDRCRAAVRIGSRAPFCGTRAQRRHGGSDLRRSAAERYRGPYSIRSLRSDIACWCRRARSRA